jgi:hypothetical protein
MKFENVKVYNFEGALRGMRNPKNSWDLNDSSFGIVRLNQNCGVDVAKKWARVTSPKKVANFVTDKDLVTDYLYWLWRNGILQTDKSKEFGEVAFIGPSDMRLAQTLIRSGPEHRKFLRQIFVTVDITAPLFWWKEFDTYKVGTVANSTSTMHKIMSKEITLESFEIDDFNNIEYNPYKDKQPDNTEEPKGTNFVEDCLIPYLEYLRISYIDIQDSLKHGDLTPELKLSLEDHAKKLWKELIRWLPESWLQTRTVTMDYENLLAMCSKGQRRFHKLTEWSGTGNNDSFIKFARRLPYAQELIFLDEVTE